MANRLDHPPLSPALPAEGREESGKLFCTESLLLVRRNKGRDRFITGHFVQ